MVQFYWCLMNLFIFAGGVFPMHSNRTIKQPFSLAVRFESLNFYLLFQQLICLQWSGAVFLAFTEYLLCQGQGVFPLNSNRTTKQRFIKVLQYQSLILDLQRIVFAVFMMFLVQFAHAYRVLFLFLWGSRCFFFFFPNELKQVN